MPERFAAIPGVPRDTPGRVESELLRLDGRRPDFEVAAGEHAAVQRRVVQVDEPGQREEDAEAVATVIQLDLVASADRLPVKFHSTLQA